MLFLLADPVYLLYIFTKYCRVCTASGNKVPTFKQSTGVPILKTGSQNNSHGRDSLSLTRRCTVNYSITQ